MLVGNFGLPGCGKSTCLAQKAKYFQKLGYRVFCLEDYPVDGCYLFKWSDLGVYDMSNSVILIDEITLYADSRNYKLFGEIVKRFFILHRHYHIDIYYWTQFVERIDKTIRDITTCLYYLRPAGMFTYSVRVDRFINIDKENCDIKVGYKLPNVISLILFGWFSGSFQLCYRPKYYQYFDSFEAPPLTKKDFPLYTKVQSSPPAD